MIILPAIFILTTVAAGFAWLRELRHRQKLELDRTRIETELAAAARTQATVLAAAEHSKQEALAAAREQLESMRAQYEARLAAQATDETSLRTLLQSLLPEATQPALAGAAQQLNENAQGALKLLEQRMLGEVGKSNTSLQTSLAQMQQQLQQYQQRIQELEIERGKSGERLEQQIAGLTSIGANMSQEARRLKEALQSGSGVRGRWGEAVLKNIFDSCGLTQDRDYLLQSTISDDDGRLRPDAIVNLPSGSRLIIDAKASLVFFDQGLQETEEAARQARYRELARTLRERAKQLAGKEYARNLENSVPCVVMFVPSEAAFRAALDADPGLFLYGNDLRPMILLASPTTLFPLISVIAQGWKQYQIESRSAELNRELQEFIKRLKTFLGHIGKIGRGLESAVNAYDAAERSYQRMLTPQMDRLQSLNRDFEQVPELEPIQAPRLLVTTNADSADAGPPADAAAKSATVR